MSLSLRWCVVLALAFVGFGGCARLEWQYDCRSQGCGIPTTPPDGGWAAGDCTTEQHGDPCTVEGARCAFTTDPCGEPAPLVCAYSAPDCGPPQP